MKNMYSDSQKYESSCLLSDRFSSISPETQELQKKVFYVYVHPCLKSFQMKKYFWNPVTKSANIFKNAVFPEKSKVLEKNRHF